MPVRLFKAILLSLTFLTSATVSATDDDIYAESHENSSEVTVSHESTHGNPAPIESGNVRSRQFSSLELEAQRYFEIVPIWLIGTEILAKLAHLDLQPKQSLNADETYVGLEQLWLEWTPPTQWINKIRFGRQTLTDQRGWWWNQEVDGVKTELNTKHTQFMFGAATNAREISTRSVGTDEEDQSILWLVGNLAVNLESFDSFGIHITHKNDRSSRYTIGEDVIESRFDETDERLTWIGIDLAKNWILSDFGSNLGDVSFSLNLAYLHGKVMVAEQQEKADENISSSVRYNSAQNSLGTSAQSRATVDTLDRLSVKSWGYDIQINFQPAFWKPSTFTLGYAKGKGSGASRESGSGTFRQTGLHENDIPYDYYGNILDPDLSNIRVASAALSLPVTEAGQLRLQYNHFRRDSQYDDSFDVEPELELSTTSREIGTEMAISFDLEFSDNLETSILVARFEAGDGVLRGQDKKIDYVEISIGYEF